MFAHRVITQKCTLSHRFSARSFSETKHRLSEAATRTTTLGFVGVGTINKAIVSGLCTSQKIDPHRRILLSPRNADNAKALKASFPNIVDIAESNQSVLDGADHVFLGMGAAQAEDVLAPLQFRPGQTVCSLMAGHSLEKLRRMSPSLTQVQLVKAVPLPPVQHQAGVTLVHPAHRPTLRLFEELGGGVPVHDEVDMSRLMTMSCLMGAQYQWLQVVTDWMVDQGVEKQTASSFVGALSHSITRDAAEAGPRGFEELIEEQTPGGVNEKAIAHLSQAGVYDALKDSLEMIYETLEPPQDEPRKDHESVMPSAIQTLQTQAEEFTEKKVSSMMPTWATMHMPPGGASVQCQLN